MILYTNPYIALYESSPIVYICSTGTDTQMHRGGRDPIPPFKVPEGLSAGLIGRQV